uniref:Uncharacterized protein n=1 Tax=Zea mays TaxID=4577 RepID=B4FV27_MAIZE|nr:unknown [Zea mays]
MALTLRATSVWRRMTTTTRRRTTRREKKGRRERRRAMRMMERKKMMRTVKGTTKKKVMRRLRTKTAKLRMTSLTQTQKTRRTSKARQDLPCQIRGKGITRMMPMDTSKTVRESSIFLNFGNVPVH